MASKVPYHIAIVLDGNRRYAKKLGLNPWEGHKFGAQKLEDMFRWCMELGIKELTLYSFSTENFNRTKKEIDFIFGLFKQKFSEIMSNKDIFKKDVKVKIIGRVNMFPKEMQKAMLEAQEKTKNNKKLIVNFALGYGGRQEITDAVKKIAKGVKEGRVNPDKIDENLISSNLYLKSEPDIFIRPGGEKRISNFLLWQSSYAELFFIEKLWPEFTKEDLINIIKEFNQRERRFGR